MPVVNPGSAPAVLVTPLVVIGTSAGGLAPLLRLLSQLPPDFPAPVVVARHLAPDQPSLLPELLARDCSLPVSVATERTPLEPGSVVVIPPAWDATVEANTLRLMVNGTRPRPSIDQLLTTAAGYGPGVVAVILSGMGFDGAAGARAVKAAGGSVLVQDPATAEYAAMPSAVDPAIIDVIADPEALGAIIVDLVRGMNRALEPRQQQHGPDDDRTSGGDGVREVGSATDSHDQRIALETARANEERYRTLFQSIDQGFCIIQVIFDNERRPVDYQFIETNNVFELQTGMTNALGRTMRELVPGIEPFWSDIYGTVVLTGEPTRFVDHAESMGRWFDVYAFRIGQPDDHQVAVLFSDITTRKREEAHLAFLAETMTEIARLTSDDDIMRSVGERTATVLDVSSCFYIDVDEERDEGRIHSIWQTAETRRIPDVVRLSDFVNDEFHRAARAGEAIVVRDTQTDPRTDAAAYAALQVGSYITMPFHHVDTWKFLFVICDPDARDWRDDEVTLVRELVDRVFPRVERARVEAALRESERKYRLLFDSLDAGFCTIEMLYDDDGTPIDYRFLDVNSAFTRQSGMRDVIGKWMRDLAPEHEPHWFTTYGRIAVTGTPERFTLEAHALDGRWFDVYAFPVSDQRPARLGVLFTDITERQRGETIRARLATLVESSRDAIVGTNLNGIITDWNPAAADLYGYTAEEAIGRDIGLVVPKDRSGDLQDRYRRMLSGERIDPYETVRMRKGGELIDVEVTISPVVDAQGRITGVAAILRDIRERREAERLRIEALEAVSHDLRNPLTTVKAQADLLARRAAREPLETERTLRGLATIQTAARRIEDQLEEFEDAARLRAGQTLEPQIGDVDLMALTSEAVVAARGTTDHHTVQWDGPDDALVGSLDGRRIRRVLDNLLSNAIRYSPDGGDILVTLRGDDRGDAGRWAVFSVRDQGLGIPAAEQPRIFERYRRGTNVEGRTRGSGIGLAGACQIVQLHGGAITVESEEGRGSIFTVELPLGRSGA